MRASQLTVGKTYNTGNYTSLRLDLTVDLEPNDDLIKARIDCEIMLDTLSKTSTSEYKKAVNVLADPDNYTGKQVKWAQDFINSINKGATA